MFTKEIMVNNYIKTLLIIKHKHFVQVIKIKDKKELLAFIKKKTVLKIFFNNVKLISAKCLGLQLLHPNTYRSTN